jgi:membrane peptidoglycan carboxypeptidase
MRATVERLPPSRCRFLIRGLYVRERTTTRQTLTRLVLFLLVSALAGALSVVVLASPVVLAATFVDDTTGAFASLPSTLAAPRVSQTSTLVAADGSRIASFYSENRTVVPLPQMSPWARKAIVAIEDARFYEHGAVDPRGILRAAVNDLTGGGTQGASTLTQQYVKNLLVEQALTTGDTAAVATATAPTLARKVREVRLALGLERQLTKDQILAGYLNIVYFGQNSYGIEAAAQRYFGVHATRLTLPQAALLAGVVQEPVDDDPLQHPAAAKARRNVVLKVMLDARVMTNAQYQTAIRTPVTITGEPLANGCAGAGRDGFFCEAVVRSIQTDPSFAALGATPAARLNAISRGGLVLRTTLDPTTQAGAVQAVDAKVPVRDSSGIAAAAVPVEPGTGKVLAMAQNRTYSVAAGRGATSVNYATDAALGGATGFQTGSSFKPFTLATWLAQGHTLDDVVDATPHAYPFDAFRACGTRLQGGQSYSPGNSEGSETGQMSVLRATADSVNTAYVSMESRLDLCDVAGTAERLGVHLASPQQECSLAKAATTKLPTCLPSLTLGVATISPLTMAAAYAGFAAGGTYCPPVLVTVIDRRSPDGSPGTSTVPLRTTTCSRALSPDVASGVNQALRHVLTDGTAAAVGPLPNSPSAGKTGTTDGPYDTWFVGYTAQRSTAVWVGDPGSADGRRVLRNIMIGGQYYPVVYGASIAAPIWKDLMTTAQQGLPARPLP